MQSTIPRKLKVKCWENSIKIISLHNVSILVFSAKKFRSKKQRHVLERKMCICIIFKQNEFKTKRKKKKRFQLLFFLCYFFFWNEIIFPYSFVGSNSNAAGTGASFSSVFDDDVSVVAFISTNFLSRSGCLS